MGLDINKVYKFNTLAPSILGDSYDLMKVKSIMVSGEAIKFRDVHTLNGQLVGTIPNLPINANDNTYVLFENNDKETMVLALEWIDEDTIELVTTVNIRIDIPDKSSADLSILKSTLLELGYSNASIYTY